MRATARPWWLPGGNLQTIWPALCGASQRSAPRRSTGASAGPRRTATSSISDWLVSPRPGRRRRAAAGAVPRPRRLVAQPLRRSLRRRRARARHGASWCRTFAAAAANSTRRRAPTTRATTRRSAGSCSGCASGHAGPLLAVGVSLGGNALMRWAGEMGGAAARTGRRGGRGVLAAGPGGRRPGHRPRLQPAGLHHDVPAHR